MPPFARIADDAETERDDVTSPEDGGSRAAGPRPPGLRSRRHRAWPLWQGRRCAASTWRRSSRWIAEMGVDARDHLFRLDRLRDEIHRADFEPPDFLLWVAERRQEDHRGVAGVRIVLEAAARLVAVDARHHDVEQDDQRLRAAGDLQRVLAVAGDEQSVVRAARAFRGGCPDSWLRHRPGESGQRPPQGLV